MSTDSAVSYLESARTESPQAPAGLSGRLQTMLDTERSTGKALLVTVLELERRVEHERQSAQTLRGTVGELESTLEEERREQQVLRVEVQRLWGEIRLLDDDLRLAERSLWRKLLRRP